MPTESKALYIAVSPGELLDKIYILQIKSERIIDRNKLQNVRRELKLLNAVRADLGFSDELQQLEMALKAINEKLWNIEDDIRKHEANKDFGLNFIELARAGYINNDERASIKKRINTLLGSAVVEEKSYSNYHND
ncbi:MAG: DUF6165 family protein [Candidatus Porifericomitaceae bacterium WSBS_2022_MAG_OTU9]